MHFAATDSAFLNVLHQKLIAYQTRYAKEDNVLESVAAMTNAERDEFVSIECAKLVV